MALSAAELTAAATAIVDDYAPGAPAAVKVAAVNLVDRSIEHAPPHVERLVRRTSRLTIRISGPASSAAVAPRPSSPPSAGRGRASSR